MFNLNDVWDHLKSNEGVIGKLRAAGDILQYALPWLALIVGMLSLPTEAPAMIAKGATVYWAVAMFLPMLVVSALKALSNYTRFGARPNGGKNSFPSGHTSGAFSGFWFVFLIFDVPLVALAMFALACVTGVSRVLAKAHWWRDVIGGALISGALVAFALNLDLAWLIEYFL